MEAEKRQTSSEASENAEGQHEEGSSEQQPSITEKITEFLSEGKEKILHMVGSTGESDNAEGQHEEGSSEQQPSITEKVTGFLSEGKEKILHMVGSSEASENSEGQHEESSSEQQPSITEKVTGFLSEGKEKILDMMGVHKEAIEDLTSISSITVEKAKEFIKQGITSLEALKKHPELLTEQMQTELEYAEELKQPVSRDEIFELRAELREKLERIDHQLTITMAGSYRRGAKESDEIVAVISHPSYTSSEEPDVQLMRNIVTELEKTGFITNASFQDATTFMGVCRSAKSTLDSSQVHHRFSIRLIPKDQLACGLLAFTGPDEFGCQLKKIAEEKGFTLSENGLQKGEETLPVKNERDIFNHLEVDYKEPHERDR